LRKGGAPCLKSNDQYAGSEDPVAVHIRDRRTRAFDGGRMTRLPDRTGPLGWTVVGGCIPAATGRERACRNREI
jgi:hypothetical protein